MHPFLDVLDTLAERFHRDPDDALTDAMTLLQMEPSQLPTRRLQQVLLAAQERVRGLILVHRHRFSPQAEERFMHQLSGLFVERIHGDIARRRMAPIRRSSTGRAFLR